MWYSGEGENVQYIREKIHDFCLERVQNEDGTYSNRLIVDNVDYHKIENGIDILVFDHMTDTIVDNIGIEFGDGYRLVR